MITLFALTLAAVALFFVLVPAVLMSLMLETNAARQARRPALALLIPVQSRVEIGSDVLLAA